MNHKGTVRLETDRLILRQFKIEDAESMYHNWASDPEVTRFLTWPTHSDVSVSKWVLQDWISRYADPAFYNWGIELKATGELVGNISVVKVSEHVDGADIGYCMGKSWWGQGIMPEVLGEVIAFLFDEVGVNRVAATHDVNNPKSGRVMEKAGMKQEGILRAAGRNNQGICDEVWHAVLKDEV